LRRGLQAWAGAVGRPALLLSWASLGLAWLAAAAGAGVEAPVVAEGDIAFHADGAVLLGAGGGEETFLYLAVPGDGVTCVALPGAEGRWMQVTATLRFLGSDGSPLASTASDLDIPCSETDPNTTFSRQVISLRVPERRGSGLVEAVLADRNAKRQDLLSQLRSAPRAGTARVQLPLPSMRGGQGLGGPLFLWGLGRMEGLARSDGFLLGDADAMRDGLEPNPARGYGLFQPTLTVYAELYGCASVATRLELRVLAAGDSSVLFEEWGRIEPGWDRCGIVRQFDVTRLAAGAYVIDLRARPAAPSGAEPAGPAPRLRGRFQVQWDPESWARPLTERMEEASLLMDPDRWARFVGLGAGQQEVLLDSLWRAYGGSELDPQQLKDLFRERIQEADARFGGIQRGSLTDRGRVFINFGGPDEIHKELAPQDEDLIYYFLRREIDQTEADDAGGRPRRHPMDTSPYQVWYYINWGRPLFPQVQSRMRGGSGGLRFIFVDEMGTGDYRLIYTNLFGGFD
jgi:GWxTD domain-containing protein